MIIIALILLIILVALIAGIWLLSNLISLLITLVIAGLVGWLADTIVPGKLPFGWLGAIVAGLLGSFVGGLLLGDLGPEIGDISIIPALVGAVILAFLADLFGKSRARA